MLLAHAAAEPCCHVGVLFCTGTPVPILPILPALHLHRSTCCCIRRPPPRWPPARPPATQRTVMRRMAAHLLPPPPQRPPPRCLPGARQRAAAACWRLRRARLRRERPIPLQAPHPLVLAGTRRQMPSGGGSSCLRSCGQLCPSLLRPCWPRRCWKPQPKQRAQMPRQRQQGQTLLWQSGASQPRWAASARCGRSSCPCCWPRPHGSWQRWHSKPWRAERRPATRL